MGHVRELYFGCVRCSLMLVQPASRSGRYSSPTLFRSLLIFDARTQPSGVGATADQEEEEGRGAREARNRQARAGPALDSEESISLAASQSPYVDQRMASPVDLDHPCATQELSTSRTSRQYFPFT
jgi:hypothetical protein